ncbi:lysostaphin resistance A-like protein [Lachnospiraceae bacterium C1.1]|nr:CPBP family intramembrane metalloprotease [Lachnospiraceae bacterium C1.1]
MEVKGNENNYGDYITYSAKLEGYKWYKPILAMLLTGLFAFIFINIIVVIVVIIVINDGMQVAEIMGMIRGGYDGFNTYTAWGAIYSCGTLASILPAMMIAGKILKWRPMSTYSSSRGGWDMKLFLKCLGISIVVVGIPIAVISYLTLEKTSGIRFSPAGLILCTILTPLQCIAEEFLFRGILLQTLGGWIKKVLPAMIISAFFFMLCHPYSIAGRVEIMIAGVLLTVMVCLTNGLEASSASHVVNNTVLFYMSGLGFDTVHTEVAWVDVIHVIIIDGVYVLILYILTKKTDWFRAKNK